MVFTYAVCSDLARWKRQVTAFQNATVEAEGLCRPTRVEGLRLCGGENRKEGFIQMFNTTINAWSLLCDPQFNDRTAEVRL